MIKKFIMESIFFLFFGNVSINFKKGRLRETILTFIFFFSESCSYVILDVTEMPFSSKIKFLSFFKKQMAVIK